MNILFITLEFTAKTFSGNGIYAQSQTRSLAAVPGNKLFVLSCKPSGYEGTPDPQGAAQLVQIPVSRWGRLDATAPWEEFAAGAVDTVDDVASFSPDVVMVVDWSALPAFHALRPHLNPGLPMVYLNYRVFTRTSTGEELELVKRLEAQAMLDAVETVVLSKSDAEYLQQNVAPEQLRGYTPKVLLCALREDMHRLPLQLYTPPQPASTSSSTCSEEGSCSTAADAQGQACISASEEAAQAFVTSRPYLTCCVRLVPEKEPDRFVSLVEQLAARGSLQRHGLTPLLVGPAKDEYAEGLKARLRAAAPNSVILEQFMGPKELGEVYSHTRLNVHPATYDAFGMTIVEAASQGAPSIVHDGSGAVGATDLLEGHHGLTGETILADFKAEASTLAARVEALLSDASGLLRVASRAAERARSWDEAANARQLMALTRAATVRRQS